MIIKMDRTRRGCEDGFKTLLYSKGVVYYDVPSIVAMMFIREGSAHEATLAEMDEQINSVP